MSMGVVSDSDLQAELDSLNKKKCESRVITIERGRGHNNETPESLRKVIGENVIEEGRAATKELTKAFGLSDSSLSAYTKGATSTATYHDPVFKDHLNRARARIVKKARHTLVQSLNHITDEKLESEKPRDLAGIAKDMSVIIKNIEPESTVEKAQGPTFVLYAPRIVKEEIYEVVQARE